MFFFIHVILVTVLVYYAIGSFCVKSPNGLNPTDSDFNEIWYTCYLGTHSTKSKIWGQSDQWFGRYAPPKLWEFRQKRARLPTFEPSYLRNELPNIHITGIDGQAIWQGFQICHSCSDWTMFGSINLMTFVMTMKLTLWITWYFHDLSWNLIIHMLPKT